MNGQCAWYFSKFDEEESQLPIIVILHFAFSLAWLFVQGYYTCVIFLILQDNVVQHQYPATYVYKFALMCSIPF